MANDDNSKNGKDGKSGGGKWWEFYVVRYALGTVVGVLIVNFLVQTGLPIPFPVGDIAQISKPEGLLLLLAYGLSYCYLASGPILLFHATRFAMNSTGVRKWTLAFLAVSALISMAWGLNARESLPSKGLLVAVVLAIFALVGLTCLQIRAWFFGFERHHDLWIFYRKLDNNRRLPENRELIESYRHLREHGNAFFVVLLELTLALCIYVAGTVSILEPGLLSSCPSGIKGCVVNTEGLVQTLVVVSVWIVPPAAVWAIGCFLENDFAYDQGLGSAATTAPATGQPAQAVQQPAQTP